MITAARANPDLDEDMMEQLLDTISPRTRNNPLNTEYLNLWTTPKEQLNRSQKKKLRKKKASKFGRQVIVRAAPRSPVCTRSRAC